jgi:hypothetical protein
MQDLIPAPAPAFTRCPCGALVLTRVWVHGTQHTPPTWRPVPHPVSPGLGVVHVCAEVADGPRD